MKKVIVSAPGKSIFFGEHAVVYGVGAIAAAISLFTTCEITSTKANNIQLNLENYSQTFEFTDLEDMGMNLPIKFKPLSRGFQLFNQRYKIDFKNINIKISSQLFRSSGLGSSASTAVALVGALNRYYGLNLEREKISNHAYEIEKIVHGTPSGIDNTICTYGNLIYYKNKQFEPLIIPFNSQLLITFTNMAHDTKKAINKVRTFRTNNPEKCEQIFQEIHSIVLEAKNALNAADLKTLGSLMVSNQELLTEIGVSNSIIDKIVKISLENGAYGSKLTGAGLGGCVITLGNDKILKNISTILETEGFPSFSVPIDKVGLRVHDEK